MKLTISRIEQIAENVRAFELQDVAGTARPTFDSGAHIEIQLADALTRRYERSAQRPNCTRQRGDADRVARPRTDAAWSVVRSPLRCS
jgi:hypothetical protein